MTSFLHRVCVAAISGLVATVVSGCSVIAPTAASPTAATPTSASATLVSAASLVSPSPSDVVAMAPACSPPEIAVQGGTAQAWAAQAGVQNTLQGAGTFNLHGASVTSVEVVVGTADAVSDPTALSAPASRFVLAQSGMPGIDSGAVAQANMTYSFSIVYSPPAAGQLPVFALIHYSPSASCGGGQGLGAQPLGWVNVK